MPLPAKPKTQEAKVIVQAMREKGIDNIALATAVGVHPSFVSQWKNGIRPVPWDKAEAVGSELGVEPSTISSEHRAMASQPARWDMEILATVINDLESKKALTAEKLKDAYDRQVAQKERVAVSMPANKIGRLGHADERRTGRVESDNRLKSGKKKK